MFSYHIESALGFKAPPVPVSLVIHIMKYYLTWLRKVNCYTAVEQWHMLRVRF